jgi:hypothetical protein
VDTAGNVVTPAGQILVTRLHLQNLMMEEDAARLRIIKISNLFIKD